MVPCMVPACHGMAAGHGVHPLTTITIVLLLCVGLVHTPCPAWYMVIVRVWVWHRVTSILAQ